MAAGDISPASPPGTIEAAIDGLVDAERTRSLWFLAADHYPRTDAERRRVLAWIERAADLETFRHVDRLRRWLSRDCSGGSASS